ncbi:ABC transporter substrate-binding protein [Desulfosporosinus sp.]|uniref:ABC transporter substrate-binding protein n=1 Tax=Desulfosporosinus sp. TaxID=157907 RepID=UPI000E8EAF50|nr:ABC transporter substrate-binding protein [Desulfosporosinus sp.]MBC2721250.1 ABC transporter substrate-binding protein [Desulfosporosinus sp.]MBC2728683.1 ABC transporter substrate-binding protein [Desulfosporosinus sp.]HBV88510.1 ABC transporter substrate-binding protein [Desulfosporosinus sp.]
MKVTRSYWLGLGSGLILSAMMVLIFSPQEEISDVQSIVNSQEILPMTEDTKQPDSPPLVQSSESTPKQNTPPMVKIPSPVDQDFVIPKGTSAERIAELLFVQGFIKDKDVFLNIVHQMRAERQFRAGTFSLSFGLTEEELIHRLLK